MKQISLIQLGVGLIGSTTIKQVLSNQARWRESFGIDVVYRGMIDTSTAVCCQDDHGYANTSLQAMIAVRGNGGSIADAANQLNYTRRSTEDAIAMVSAKGPAILLDTAAGTMTGHLDAMALEQGLGVVLSNKAPLALDIDDRDGESLWQATGLAGMLRYETTCGAGLPVISTLQTLLASGDSVIDITGSLSGTFGAIFSELAADAPFSQAVKDAKALGFTEPDPRDDLSGLDVARKALILARTLGRDIDLDQIEVESLVPEVLVSCSVDEFMASIHLVDDAFSRRGAAAAAAGQSLKYVASVPMSGQVSVGLREIPSESVLGSLQGPENVVTVRTMRYDAHPLTIAGPGAGAAVTAAGVIGDMLQLAIQMTGE